MLPAVMLPRRAARVAATTFDNFRGSSTSSLGSMEMGDRGQQQLQRDSSDQRVSVAATEVLEHEGNNRESAANSRRLLVLATIVVLQGLVAGFGCFFAYVWVDFFRKGRFNESLGVVTVMFVGAIVCAWGCRRRLVPMIRPEERVVIGRELQPRPKDNPPQTRQGFDYFVYPAEASSSTGSETSISCSDDDSGVNMPSAAFESAASFTDIEAPAASNSSHSVGDESPAPSGEVPATEPSVAHEQSSKSCSASEDDGAAPLPPLCETKEDESRVETENDQQHAAATTAKTTGSFSWTPTATPTECMVCLESYKAGDRVCRIPCAHIFHAECIENWLDQNPSCPECRLELHSDDVEEMRRAPASSPASTLPEEAFQFSVSSGDDVSSPPTSTAAAAQPPATSPSSTRRRSGSSTTSPPSHPDLFSTSRVYGPASAASTPNTESPAQRQLSPDCGPASTATPTTTTPTRVQASTVADSSDDMTDINTAINAATAPFARYFGGSPMTEAPASPTFSVVRFVGLSPEPGQQGDKRFGTATPLSSSLETPFACFFDSPPCNHSPLRGNTDMSPQLSLPAAPYSWILDSPDFDRPTSQPATPQPQPPPPTDLGWSPYSPGSSDAGEGRFADLTELNTAINATANDVYALNSAAVAPFGRYFESFESPTSIIRFVGGFSQEFDQQDEAPYRSSASHVPEQATPSSMVPFRSPGGSGLGPVPFARNLESPSYFSASPLSAANMAHFPLSRDFMRTPRAADREESRGDVTAPHRIAPYYSPVPFRQQQQRKPQPQPQPQQPQQPHHVGAHHRNGGGEERVPGYRGFYGAMESLSPPRPPPRLVFTPSPAVGRGASSRGGLRQPPPTPALPGLPVQPAGGKASSAFAAENGREQGGEIVRVGSGAADCWVWPLSSASMWDNKAWPAIGGRVRIDSLDESAHVRQEERGRSNVRQDHEGAQPAMRPPVGSSGGGRWVWQSA